MTNAEDAAHALHDRGRLRGRRAIVSGAGSSGDGVSNGQAIAVSLAREGADLVLVDHDPDAVMSTAEAVRREGARCETVIGDVGDWSTAERAAQRSAEAFGGIEILVNNVGVSGAHVDIEQFDLVEWNRVVGINLTSMLHMTKAAAPHLQTAGGAIVNVGSVAGQLGSETGSLAYSITKGAVVPLTRSLAAQQGKHGIRVNCVVPGMVFTPMVAKALSPEQREARSKQNLLKVEGTAWDIGLAVAFLVSDDARWITGVTLPVDGGLMASLAAPHVGSVAAASLPTCGLDGER